MKRFINNTLYLCAMLLFAAACQMEEFVDPTPGDDIMQGDKFVILLDPSSKTANDGMSTVWVEGDKVNVFHAKAGTTDYVNDGEFVFTSGTQFTGKLAQELQGDTNYDWYVSYPYNEKMTSPKKMSISIPTEQRQSEDGSTAHLCGSLCPLAGKKAGVPAATVPTVGMKHLVTVMKIKVTNYEEIPCELRTVSFSHHSSFDGNGKTILTGDYSVDFTGEQVLYAPEIPAEPNVNIGAWEENKELVTTKSGVVADWPHVALDTRKTLNLNESATVYLACVPFTIENATFLSIGMNKLQDGIAQRICKHVECKAGKMNGIKQGSHLAPPLKDAAKFYYGVKKADGSYEIIDENWWRCDLPEGFDLNGEFDFKDLFTTMNVDASFTLIDAPNQNATIQYYFNDFQACLNGSKWNGTALNPDLNLSSPGLDKSGVFISVYAGYQVGNFNIFFRNPSSEPDEPVVDMTSDMYDSYQGLVMCGYQGWHGTPGDGCSHNPDEAWPHYCDVNNKPFIFEPGVLKNSIDFWPDITEYEKTYAADGFTYPDGSQAMVYSSYDESTVNLHFKWMKDYNIDGVFMQRFVSQITQAAALDHSDKVLASAMAASNEHARAIAIMYDMVGMDASTSADVILNDAAALKAIYNLDDRSKGQRYYLYHNGKPLIGLVSVGQKAASYTIAQAQEIVDGLQAMGFSVMLGVPAYWRNPGDGDCVNDSNITNLIKDVDIIMPWLVGVYDYDGTTPTAVSKFSKYFSDTMDDSKTRYGSTIKGDYSVAANYGVEYCPLVFAGFSDQNMHPDHYVYDRHGGNFYWEQIYKNLNKGAKMLYVAMFDEIDEGTAIYKCLRKSEVPSNVSATDYYVVCENGVCRRSDTQVSVSGDGNWCKKASELNIKFQGFEDDQESDYYMWLTGQAAKILKGQATLTQNKPTR